MANENIRLIKTQQSNFAVSEGYFYTFDYLVDSLLQKTDDGNTAFSYPTDELLAYSVYSAEFDGVYFWSLERPSAGTVTIKRWKLDNYICKLQQTYTLPSGVSHYYDAYTFSVEHYHTTMSGTAVSGASTIYINDYYDNAALMGFTTSIGDGLTIHLGPNSAGEEQDVEVDSVVADGIVLIAPLDYDFAASDPVNFYTNIWVFNNRDGVDAATGALYKFDAYTGAYLTKYRGGAYQSIRAATFYNVDSFPDYGKVDTLAFVKGTNMLFIDVSDAGASLPYYGSMVMENIQLNKSDVIAIYDLAMSGQNVYRLQDIPDGSNTAWSYYSYLLSSLDDFVTSISLAAYPAMVAANAIATSKIEVTVRDQFLLPIISRTVTFSAAGTGHGTIPATANTNSNGWAAVDYTSGTLAGEITITAIVNQT